MSKNTKSRGAKAASLAVNAMLTAIIVLMAFTPLGYLTVGPVKMTLIMLPVAAGAITMGPGTGAFLGLVFGATSFIQCFGLDPFGSALLSINPVFTFILCLLPRTLMGCLCGLIFKGTARLCKSAAYVIASLSAAVLNTVFFIGLLMLFFGKSQFIAELRGGLNIFAFLAAFVGINGLCEAVACGLIGAPVAAGLDAAVKKYKLNQL